MVNHENSGGVEGTLANDDRRDTYSKNYPGMTSGVHKVWTYEPSPSMLRAVVLAMAANGGQLDQALEAIPLNY